MSFTPSGGMGGFSLAVLSELAAPVADPEALKKPARTAEEIRGDLLAHAEQSPVAATVCLGTTRATMREIATLEPGDILLLGRTADAPIELSVMGNVVHCGLPVQSEGWYAFQVLERRESPRVSVK
jgi:flagellar motor switch protein FliM